jgi:hypothetical protein
LDTALQTFEAVVASRIDTVFDYTVYNDFSTEENTLRLKDASERMRFRLVNLSDITVHPSPNYLLILQQAQANALSNNAHLLIIESDVTVSEDTVRQLYAHAQSLDNAGMVAAVTVDASGAVNFPYLYAGKYRDGAVNTRKRLSFCCTLLTNAFLSAFDFRTLPAGQSWYDVTISHQALRMGFRNYLLMQCPVLHRPHSSRPWKLLKYSNPVKYYWLKLTGQLQKRAERNDV